jgi:hypothetical protein
VTRVPSARLQDRHSANSWLGAGLSQANASNALIAPSFGSVASQEMPISAAYIGLDSRLGRAVIQESIINRE